MRLGRFPDPTGDPRIDALNELRWAMAGSGLTVEKLRVMDATRRLPGVAVGLLDAEAHAVPRAAFDALCSATHDLGDSVQARLLRNALGVDYQGCGKDLTARRLEFVAEHNASARSAGSRNLLPETPRALFAIEQQMLEALVTALGASAVGATPEDTAPTGLAETSTTPPVPRYLPAAPSRFCGRGAALAWLDANALGDTASGEAPSVVAIDGTAGVGKTALALHWAHRVAERFPDGQLHVDLRAYARGGAPLSSAEALSRLLAALGVPPHAIPAEEEQRAGAYRSVTAGKRLLVFLDNAATSEQVRPLIPAAAGCTVLVTSRNALPGLVVGHGARVLTLGVLPRTEATALFDALLGVERAGIDPDAASDVAALCGHLPLALRIVTAKLQTEPDTTFTDMATRLRARDRLTTLGFGDEGEVGVRGAFALSYDSLDEDARRAFRMLGLAPGADVTDETAAALLDSPSAAAEQLLDRLAAGHLLARTTRGRYQLHDLLRDYAVELCLVTEDAAERHTAIERLLTFCIHKAADATGLLHPGSVRVPGDRPDSPAPPQITDRDAAIAWLDAERESLAAAVGYAATQGHPTAAWRLAFAMRGCFLLSFSGAELLPIAAAGLAGAEHDGHQHAASAMHRLLGSAYRQLGDLPAAAHHVSEALARSRAVEWAEGEMIAHCALGGILQDQGHLARAITHHQSALDIERRRANPAGGGAHLRNIGMVLCQIGRFADAAGYLVEALEIATRNGDERAMAIAQEMLGAVNHQFGKLDEAAADIERALATYRRLDFRDVEAECLSTNARLRCDLGDLPGAQADARESLRLAQSLDDARIHVVAANTLGEVALRTDDVADAERHHRTALDLATGIGYRFGQVTARVGLAAVAVASVADAQRGLALAEDAVVSARMAGLLALEARALTVLGRARLALDDRAGAVDAGTRALDIHLECGSRLGARDAEALLAAASGPPARGRRRASS